MPDIGKMRTRVSVQRRTTAQDASGEQLNTWDTLGTLWADIVELKGRELEAAQAVRENDTHTLLLRYFPGLTVKDRFLYLNPEQVTEFYNITNITDVEMRHRYMLCTAEHGLITV